MIFSKIKQEFEVLNQDIRSYIEVKLEYFELLLIQKITEALVKVKRRLLIAFFLLAFVCMLSVAIAICIGQNLGNMSWGFFIVAGGYLVLLILLLILWRPIFKRFFGARILKKISKVKANMKEFKS